MEAPRNAAKSTTVEGVVPNLLPLVAFALTLAALVMVGAQGSAITVNVTSPANGTWVGSDTVGVSGSAADPSSDAIVIAGGAEFQGGTNWNTTVNASGVTQTFPDLETYAYYQDFSGLSGQVQIDDHWMWPVAGTLWNVAQTSGPSSDPPWLRHAGNHGDKIYWDVVLPGSIVSANLSFYYYCESNGALSAGVSTDGKPSEEDLILNQVGAVGETALFYDVAAGFSGSSAVHVRFWSTPINPLDDWWTACAIDSFRFVATFPRTPSANYTFSDDFTESTGSGIWSVWGFIAPGWIDSNVSAVSDTGPSLVHSGIANTTVWASWGMASSIRNTTVRFHYQCEANASLSAFTGPYSNPTQILAGFRGAGHTAFTFDATNLTLGLRAFSLGFAADAVNSANSRCGVDDVAVQFTVAGNLNVTYPGWYKTPALDLGSRMNLTGLSWTGDAPVTTEMNVSFRSSLDNLSFTPWQPVDANGSVPVTRQGRYVQFLANFTSKSGVATAALYTLRLDYAALVVVDWSSNGIAWNPAMGITNWSFVAPLAPGANSLLVRATDTRGFMGSASVTILRDTFPPAAPGEPQGPLYSNSTTVTWIWTPASDTGLGVDHYVIDLGTSPNGTELGGGYLAFGASYTAASLPDGATVYARVHAVDAVGLPGPIAFSPSPTVIDTLPPNPVQLPGGLTQFVANATLSWNWPEPTDSGSGIDHYIVALGTSSGASDVFSGVSPTPVFSIFEGVDGETYFLTVAAVDRTGNVGQARTSGGIRLDLSTPTAVEVLSSPPTPTRNLTLSWSWNPAFDNISGLDHYAARLGTSAGADDVASLNTTSPIVAFTVPGSGVFFFSVQAFDRVGNAAAPTTSLPVTVDIEPPEAPTLEAVAPFVKTVQLTVRWSSPADGPAGIATGLSGFELRVSANGALAYVKSVPDSQAVVNLADGTRYLVEVSAVDSVGNVGARSGISFTADLTGPNVGAIFGSITDPAVPEFEAHWDLATDLGSGIREYQVVVTAGISGAPILNRTVSNETRVAWKGEFGTSYFVSVLAVDNAGNGGAPATSEALVATRPAESGGGGDGLLIYLGLGGASVAVAVGLMAFARRRRLSPPKG